MQRRALIGLSLTGIPFVLAGRSDHPIDERYTVGSRVALSDVYPIMHRGSGPDYVPFRSILVDRGEIGLHLKWANGYRISGLKFSHIAGSAVKVERSMGGYSHVGFLSQIHATHSFRGFHFANLAEYETVTDCSASFCLIGFLVSSGNNAFSNCKATDCTTGVKITGGLNHAHGVWNGLIANHCTYNLVCEDVTNGEHFSGSCFIGGQGRRAGKISIVRSHGISIVGGQISDLDIFIDARSQILLSSVTFGGKVNVQVEPGGTLVARNNLVMPNATLTLNGEAWVGSDEAPADGRRTPATRRR